MGYGSFHLNTSYKSAACLRLTSFYALTMKNLRDKEHITLSLLGLLCLIRFISMLLSSNQTNLHILKW